MTNLSTEVKLVVSGQTVLADELQEFLDLISPTAEIQVRVVSGGQRDSSEMVFSARELRSGHKPSGKPSICRTGTTR